MPSLQTLGEALMETNGCSKAAPVVADGTHVSCIWEPAKEDPGTQHVG